jgi:hypothetical protein
MMVDYEKPLTLSLLAYIFLLLAFLFIAVAVYVLFGGEKFWNDGLLEGLQSETIQLFVIMGFSVLMIISSIGLLKTSPAGRGLLIMLSIISAVQGAAVALSDITRGIVIIILCIILILYLNTYDVKSVFQSIDSRKSVNAIESLESYRRGRSLK